MQRLLLIAAVLATLVYALVLGVKWLSPKIETDLTNRLTTELAQSGQLWANLQIEGRNVTLLGEAPTADAQSAARGAVARVFGISQLTDLTTLPGQEISGTEIVTATTPIAKLTRAEMRAKTALEKGYTLTITKEGNTLTLNGAVPEESDKVLLLRLAELHFPDATLNTISLTVVEGAPAGWRSAAGTVLFNLANLETAEAKLLGREIMVSGTVLAADFATSAEENIRNTVPEQYRV
ncbi:MAG: BON domain-containing protein, partial [Pseudomonadota bacterium]